VLDEDQCYEEFSTDVLGFPVRVVARRDGRPIRPILSGRRARPVWSYYSLKCGTGLPCESGNELHALYHAEVSTDVVEYRVQPCTMHFTIGGRVRSYTPDLEEALSDGRVRITEVKDRFEADADPEYSEKLLYAAEYCRARGQLFRIQDRAEIELPPLFDTVDVVQSFRRTAVTINDVMRLREHFSGRDVLPLGQARELFGTAPLGFAKLAAMMVRRIVAIDLTKRLSTETPVQMLRPRMAPAS